MVSLHITVALAISRGAGDRQQIGLITGNSCLVTLYFLLVIRFTQVSEVSDAGYNSMTCGNSCCTDRLIVDLWLGEDS